MAQANKRARPHGPQAYRGNGNHQWELVTQGTTRLRVPGGWLYRNQDIHLGGGVGVTVVTDTMVFVPAPEVIGYAI